MNSGILEFDLEQRYVDAPHTAFLRQYFFDQLNQKVSLHSIHNDVHILHSVVHKVIITAIIWLFNEVTKIPVAVESIGPL